MNTLAVLFYFVFTPLALSAPHLSSINPPRINIECDSTCTDEERITLIIETSILNDTLSSPCFSKHLPISRTLKSKYILSYSKIHKSDIQVVRKKSSTWPSCVTLYHYSKAIFHSLSISNSIKECCRQM